MKKKLLIIDDERSIVESLTRALMGQEFELTSCTEPEKALEAIKEVIPQVVISDLKMPKMDGWEACERIKKNPITCGIPVIFLTAFDQAQDHERAHRLCVQGYVTKPCEPSDLVRTIQKIIPSTLSRP